jgi:hypothetical protein
VVAVGVLTGLGLADGLDSDVLRRAADGWHGWVGQDDRLAVVPGGVVGLRSWLAGVAPAAADEVLHALARRGAADGGDDVAAAGALAWALVPGARALAAQVTRMRLLGVRADMVDHLVAAELWLQIRGFPWQRLRKVAANLLMNTRTGVLRELGVGRAARRADRTWSQVVLVDPGSLRTTARAAGLGAAGPRLGLSDTGAAVDGLVDGVLDGLDGHGEDAARAAAARLLEVLDWACGRGVIGGRDRSLLLSVVAAARCGDGPGELTARRTVERVADDLGLCERTVRRRLGASVAALTAAVSRVEAVPAA